MKIGIVAPGGFDRSGRERVIPALLWLVERLARRHEVHVFTLLQYPQPQEYTLRGAVVHNIGYTRGPMRGLRRMGRTLRALKQEHRRGRFDALHGLWLGECGLAAALGGRFWGCPGVVSGMGGELTALPDIGYGGQLRRRSRWITALTLQLAGAVTVASRYMVGQVEPYRPDVRRIPLGVDTRCFSPPQTPPSGPPWRLLHVASLNRVKDQPTLLRAFRVILDAEPSARLNIVGEDVLCGEIQRLAGDLGVDRAVAFHGFRPVEEVAGFMRESHLLLHSSRHEAGPLVLLEAAACGVASVGTAVGHFAELAPDAAVAVSVGDAEALGAAALRLLCDEERRREIGRRARAFACAHDAEWTAAQFEALYDQRTGR